MGNEETKEWMESLDEQIRVMLSEKPEYEKLLAIFREMLVAQREARDSLPDVEMDFDANRAAVCARAGMTLLGEVNAKLDMDAAIGLLAKLKEIACRHGDEYTAEVAKIDEAIEEGALDMPAVLEEAFHKGSAEELKKKALDLGFDPHFFAMLIFSSIRPNLELYAAKLRSMLDDRDWEKHNCPVCGRLPYIARLETKEGTRSLCCPACSTVWRFPRLKCVNCGIEDHEKLRMLFPEGGSRENYADVCDNCKRYIKVIDTRTAVRMPVMMIADVGTLHLDMLAQREGFVTL